MSKLDKDLGTTFNCIAKNVLHGAGITNIRQLNANGHAHICGFAIVVIFHLYDSNHTLLESLYRAYLDIWINEPHTVIQCAAAGL